MPMIEEYASRERTVKGIFQSSLEDPLSVFQQFNTAGIDYKGQISSAYFANGVAMQIGASVDVLGLLGLAAGVPAIPGVSIDVGLELKGNLSKETMVIMQRFPQQAFEFRVGYYSYTDPQTKIPTWYYGRLTNPSQKLWPVLKTSTPITLLVLGGRAADIAITLSAGISIGLPFSTDELGLTLNPKISGAINGRFIRLKDNQPLSYPSPGDGFVFEFAKARVVEVLEAQGEPKPVDSVGVLRRWAERIKLPSSKPPPPVPVRNIPGYFHLFAFSGLIGADVTVKGSAGVPFFGTLAPLASAGATAGVSGEAGIMSYRVQTVNDPVVYTQDTWITNRCIKAAAKVFASLSLGIADFDPTIREQSLGPEYAYYTMSYESVCRYWNRNKNPWQLLNGSGVSYGMSVSSKRLINCITTPGPKSQALISSLAKQLRVSTSTIQDFISKAGSIIKSDKLPKYVFIESSFGFPSEVSQQLNQNYEPANGLQDSGIIAFMNKINSGYTDPLEAIRIRWISRSPPGAPAHPQTAGL
ncbi:MAG: hypothetical protein HUU34_09430 [Saprospiraceae bacterium]|nr:hypothetical protein [Saprospiraceae bacterium]